MTDIEIAASHLKEHSICLCKNGDFFTDDGEGISPMMKLILEKRDLRGYSVADVIVGKAAAILFVKAGIIEVYGEVISTLARDYLKWHNIPCTFVTLTEKIINHKGDGICPMEQAVAEIDDCETGYLVLKKAVRKLQ